MTCFWRHQWTKWSDRDTGTKVTNEEGPKKCIVGIVVFQERRCEKCNQLQLRLVQATL